MDERLLRIRLSFASPGEIKRREVELDSHEEVRLSFAGLGEIKKREVVLDPQERPPRRDQEQGVGAGLRKLDLSFTSFVPQQQCYGHCLCDCSAQQMKQQLRCILAAMQWRGPHCLKIAVVLAVAHCLLGLLRVGLRGRAIHSFPPPPSPRP